MESSTAGDLINRALRLLGVLAEGETSSAETSADALTAFRQMLDSWKTEPLMALSDLVLPSTLSDAMTVPSGYLRAFAYNLAMELSPEFGVEPSTQVHRVAMVSKRDIKRVNDTAAEMELPRFTTGLSTYNVLEG